MKLTFVLPNLRLYGGIKSTIAMADAMAGLGHEVTLVSPFIPGRDGRGWFNLRKTAAQCWYTLQNLVHPPNWFNYRGKLRRPLRLTPNSLPAADFLILTWWADVALLHDVPPEHGLPLHFVRSLETWGGPREKVLATYQLDLPRIVSSGELGTQLRQIGSDALPGTISNGLDRIFTDLPFRVRPAQVPPRVGVLYRQQEWKRMDDAFAVLTRCRRDRMLIPVFFGETPTRQHRQLMREWQAEYHHLPSGDLLRSVYESLDVFLFTSDSTEAFGNPPFEALAASVPVVTTDVGAVRELLQDGESAIVCDVNDLQALASGVLELLDSPDSASAMARAGHRVASGLHWDQSAQKLEAVLDRLLQDSSATMPV